MNGLRVLHVAPYAAEAWAYGGIPRVLAALSRGLARRGHRVTVCATDAADAHARLPPGGGAPEPDGVEIRLFRNVSNAAAYRLQFFTPLGLSGFLRRHATGFDVAHLHGCHHLPGFLAARAMRRAGVPYVLTPNGTAPRIERRRGAKWLFDATLGRGVLPGAARVLAVSRAEAGDLAALGVAAERLGVLPNPLPTREIVPPPRGSLRARLGLGEAPLVLFLGVLSPRKGADVLVEAFARLGVPGARLVIAGNDGGSAAALRRRVAAHGIGEAVTFTGLLRGADRLAALADADAVTYPSRHEAFGLVPLEALLCGAPVVVGDDHGCGEVIGETGGGLRVPPGDAEALATALRAILGARDRWRGEAIAAAARVRERFDADVVCARLEAIYGEVLGGTAVARVA
jgi:glycosyltransferase involved in cell wall biosynthesis